MSVRLKARPVGWLTAPGGQALRTKALENKWMVEPLDREVHVFKVGPIFSVSGRKGEYRSLEEALAVLQKEADVG
jgi:hypothetical protein